MGDTNQTEGQQSAGAYAKALKNVQDTISTADSLRGFFMQARSDVKDYLNWKTQLNNLLEDLGEWAPVVYRPDGWWLPILRAEPFENYLREQQGILSPAPDCRARVGWAKLLHVLGLRPTDTRTLDWKSTRKSSFDPTAPDAIRLEVEGRVLCHIVNLFQLYGEENNDSRKNQRAELIEFHLSFGTFSIKRGGSSGRFLVTFDEKSQKALGEQVLPFQWLGMRDGKGILRRRGRHSACEQGTAFVTYELALAYGISKAQLALSLDGHRRPRKDRARDLIRAIEAVDSAEKSGKKDFLLITKQWVDDAQRIWRRVTVNPDVDGKADTRLINFLVEGVCSSPEVRAPIPATITKFVEGFCMTDGRALELYWDSRARSNSYGLWYLVLHKRKRELLSHLKGAWEGEWNAELAEMVDDGSSLAEVLDLPQEIVNAPIIFLPLTEGHPLWDSKARCHVDI
ncbi:hypothetical protein QBC47DRAFT_373853 [Echria macrotheca]|uniref:Uncharacterized protein n=1 Tax=Echria macrotheca TaxID=438768 RepID=A0AAJ0BH50_9PEZI|nr:hypothetical protein QBC47DRAFT_373853 [Echria macrotheca]